MALLRCNLLAFTSSNLTGMTIEAAIKTYGCNIGCEDGKKTRAIRPSGKVIRKDYIIKPHDIIELQVRVRRPVTKEVWE